MFTGLIEQQGEVKANIAGKISNRLRIQVSWSSLQVGESISVNGVCLTLLSSQDYSILDFDVSPETLQLTNLGQLKAGDSVNLERAMLASDRLGGHYVSGHVDTTALVQEVVSIGQYMEIKIGNFSVFDRMYLLPKGSITLEGVSLTINEALNGIIKIMLVPHTLIKTTLKQLKAGQRLNVEFDYLSRIIAHQLKLMEQLKNEVQV